MLPDSLCEMVYHQGQGTQSLCVLLTWQTPFLFWVFSWERGSDYKVSPNSKGHENQIKQFGFPSKVFRSHWRVLVECWMLLIERPLCWQWRSSKRVWREKDGPIAKDKPSVQSVMVTQYQPSDGPYFLLLSRQWLKDSEFVIYLACWRLKPQLNLKQQLKTGWE